MLDRSLVTELEQAALGGGDAAEATARVRVALAPWLARPLPASHTTPGQDCYARHLLHCDPQGRFCAVAIVLAPGQSTPVHNHTTWGVIGVVTGREREIRYRRRDDGSLMELGTGFNLPGQMSVVIPPKDIHRIEGAAEDGGLTISIHVYGGRNDKVTGEVFEAAGVPVVGPCKTALAPI